VIPRGAGKIVFLGYDWFDAVPRGIQNGGWDETLRRALAEAVPVTTSIPPMITTQPQSQTVSAGSPALFSVSAGGSAPMRYQWRKNNLAIAGATNSSYALSFVQYSNAGNYSVVVSNAFGVTNSAAATLTVTPYATNIVAAAFDQGWYNASGFHDPFNPNYYCGDSDSADYPPLRNWFAFNIPPLPGPVVAAQLRLNTYNINSPTGSETYRLHHVSTAVTALTAGGSGLVSIYNDLADGVVYGSRSFSTDEANQFITMNLNADCITNLVAAAGQPFALGGAITTLDATPANNEAVFSSSGGGINDVQLIITLGVNPAQLKLLTPTFLAGRLRLFVTTVDDSPITPDRASNIWVYASTNVALPLSNWTALATAPVLTNGLLMVDGINPTNPPALFFRAIEGSWNVRPLRLHLPPTSGNAFSLRASAGDGSLLTPIRAAKIHFYSTTNVALPFSAWQPVAGSPVLSNGVLQINGPLLTNSPALYFRAEETP